VRREVAERAPIERLRVFIRDVDLRVRYRAAERLPLSELPLLASDEDPSIRELVSERLNEAAQSRENSDGTRT
jgi:oligoendopeptidase F